MNVGLAAREKTWRVTTKQIIRLVPTLSRVCFACWWKSPRPRPCVNTGSCVHLFTVLMYLPLLSYSKKLWVLNFTVAFFSGKGGVRIVFSAATLALFQQLMNTATFLISFICSGIGRALGKRHASADSQGAS